jgi:hypothetical protein
MKVTSFAIFINEIAIILCLQQFFEPDNVLAVANTVMCADLIGNAFFNFAVFEQKFVIDNFYGVELFVIKMTTPKNLAVSSPTNHFSQFVFSH